MIESVFVLKNQLITVNYYENDNTNLNHMEINPNYKNFFHSERILCNTKALFQHAKLMQYDEK